MDEVESAKTMGTTAGDLDVNMEQPDAGSSFVVLVYVYVAIVMVMGLLGNLMVAVVYVAKFKASTTRCFIVAMAIADLLGCAIVMPLDLGELFTSSNILCKAQRCSTALTYIFSGYLTLVVAVDRYRRICHPFAPQLSVQGAKRAIMGCLVIAVVFAWPQILVSGEQPAEVPGLNVTRTKCDSVKFPDGIPYDVIFYTTVSFQCFGGAVAMVVLYSIIGCKMSKRQRSSGISPFRQDETPATTSSTNDTPDLPAKPFSEGVQLRPEKTCPDQPSHSPNASSSGVPQFGTNRKVDNQRRTVFRYPPISKSEKVDADIALENEQSQDPRSSSLEGCQPIMVSLTPMKLEVRDIESEGDLDGDVNIMTRERSFRRDAAFRNMTHTLFLITLIYILSFLPFIVMRVLSGNNVFDGVGGEGLAVIEVLYRTLYITSASNPVLYGVRHVEFRAKCMQLLRCRK